MTKRSLDEDSKKQSSSLEGLKKVAKPTVRKIEDDFERREDDALPLACSRCRQAFLSPVVTKCQHYFCHCCAIGHHAKNSTCFVCGQPTLGVFNIAVEIKEKIAKERKRARAMVLEVSQMVEKASEKVGNAKSMATEAAAMVKEVETLVAKAAFLAEKAVDMAVDAGEMVQEADVIMERAKTGMAKASVVMKTLQWNV